MHTRGGDAVTTRSGVNYSTYTTVATPQDIDQMIYFKAFVRFLYSIAIASPNASLANSKT